MLKKMSLEVGCFGKLPLSPEFIRVNAKGPVLQAFDQWLQEGLYGFRASAGGAWLQDYLRSDMWEFLYAVPGVTECLVGVVAPAQDKAGRGFPMAIFLRIDTLDFVDRLHKVPLYFQSFLEWARHMLAEDWKTYSLQEFREQVGGWEANEPDNCDSLDRLYREFLGAYTLEGLLQLCDAGKGLVTVAAVEALVRGMMASHQAPNRSKPGQLMPFPLIHDPALPFEIPFWLDFLKKTAKVNMDYPILFWNKCPQQGPAVVFMQEAPVSPKSFSQLMHPRSIVEQHWPVRAEGQAQERTEEDATQEEWETLDRLLRR